MRGQKLFNDVLKTEQIKAERKGRNDSLMTKRNTCLIARYYYYGYCKEKCYEDILELLEQEFFLSKLRITRLVQQHIDSIKEMKDKEITPYLLQAVWPQFKWS